MEFTTITFDGASPAGGDVEPARKRQRRKPIACLECRRRKSKCDRQLPCSECIKRGEANLCQGGSTDSQGSNQTLPFAMPVSNRPLVPANAAVVESLARRVHSIEQLLGKIAGTMPAFRELSNTFSATLGNDGSLQSQTSPDSILAEDGLEDAVKMLEQAAFEQIGEPAMAHRSPSNNVDQDWQTSTETSIWQSSAPSRVYGAYVLCKSHVDPLSAIVATFPPVDICKALISAFLEHVDYHWHYIHRSTFQKECELFWSIGDPVAVRRIDPAWLALFANAMARGAKAIHYQGLQVTIETDLHVQLHSASQLALTYAEWTSRPQARVIQTLIGTICLLPHSGSPFFNDPKDDDLGGGNHGRVLIGVAVSLARLLRLDTVTQGATPETHPIFNDPSFPFPGPSSLHTELCRRWWWSLVALDAKSCMGRKNERHILPGSFSTPLPSPVLDESLGRHHEPKIEPPMNATDADAIIYQGYLVELLDGSPETTHPSYEQALALDALWRPHFLEMLLRIHRPYFLQGLRDERFARSSKTCLTCAHVILATYASADLVEYNINHWYSYQHVTSAVLIVVLAHIYRVRKRGRHTETDEGLLEATKPALDFFARGTTVSSETIRTTAKLCLGIVNLLHQVGATVGGNDAHGADHMVDLLKQISQRARERDNSIRGDSSIPVRSAADLTGQDDGAQSSSVPSWLSPKTFGQGFDNPFSEELTQYLNANLVDFDAVMGSSVDNTFMANTGGEGPDMSWLFNT